MKSRVYLRAFELDDFATTIKWRKNRKIWNMLGGPHYFVSSAYEKRWCEDTIFNSKDIRLAICLTDSNRHIGNIYITNIDMINGNGTSHILIGEEDCWGKGYGTEALNQILDYAFNERRLHRIEARVLEDNIASIKMHEKCGYRIDGKLRDAVYKGGHFKSLITMSILDDEYRNK